MSSISPLSGLAQVLPQHCVVLMWQMRGRVGEGKSRKQDRVAVASLPSHALQCCSCLASLKFVAMVVGIQLYQPTQVLIHIVDGNSRDSSWGT